MLVSIDRRFPGHNEESLTD